MQNILELQCLVDDLGDVLELLMFINVLYFKCIV